MDSSGEKLHPNWRALATLHLPLKRFVPEKGHRLEERKTTKNELQNFNGQEMQKFYAEVLETKAQNNCCTKIVSKPQQVKKVKLEKTEFNAANLFRAATCNDVASVSNMQLESININTKDEFDWTALMMAACAGAEQVVDILLNLGADSMCKDKSGKNAADLALKKGYMQIANKIKNHKNLIITKMPEIVDDDFELADEHNSAFYCEICEQNFTESAHLTSTLHKFCKKSITPVHSLHKFNITPRNRGLQLMKKQGWDCESGLGPKASGRLYPIKTVIRKQRSGLGVNQAPARVTHFEAFDLRATKSDNSKYKKPRTRNDMTREKLRAWKKQRRLRSELS